jgi:hypothetical protein
LRNRYRWKEVLNIERQNSACAGVLFCMAAQFAPSLKPE